MLAPGVYFLLNVVEGNIVTPAVLGRELTLNSVAIFVADNTETLSPLGAFLSR